jgi:hypothetical protein
MQHARLFAALVAFALAAQCAAPATAQQAFAIDLDPPAIRAATGSLIVDDLAVGEVGIVVVETWCARQGALYGAVTDRLEKSQSDYGLNFQVRREPANTLSVVVVPGSMAGKLWSDAVLTRLEVLPPCDQFELFGHRFLPISSVNGFVSVAAIAAAKGKTIP